MREVRLKREQTGRLVASLARRDGRNIAPSDPEPYVVGFLLPPEFILVSYAAALEPLRAANTLSGKTLYVWKCVSLDGKPVASLSGGTFDADYAVGDDFAPDLLLACCPSDSSTFHDEPTFSWLRRVARRGVTMGAISGGVFIIARAGLLDGYRHTVAWPRIAAFREEFPDHEVVEALYVIDRNRITCGGGFSSSDMMHALIKTQHGNALADAVSEWFLQTQIRAEDDPQRMSVAYRLGVSHTGLINALEAMEASLEEPLSRQELAVLAEVSERHLDRLFLTQVGTPLSDYYLKLRLDRARQLVRQSGMPLLEIAIACGFNRASTFSKVYRRIFNIPPSKDRSASRQR
jgi:transcriptional regulator GlxA family with amidase domain